MSLRGELVGAVLTPGLCWGLCRALLLLGTRLIMGHQGKTHRLDLKAALLHCWGSACCTLSMSCQELAVLEWFKEGAGAKACLALPFHPCLGRCSSPQFQPQAGC